MVEVFAVFGQLATGIVAAVVAFARLEEVAHAVGHAVEAFHLAAAFVLGRDEVVELVVVVPSHAARNLVARHQQAVAHVPRVAAAELLHVARADALERLAPEPVAPGGDVHAAR